MSYCYTPDNVRVIHFGNTHEFYGHESGDEPYSDEVFEEVDVPPIGKDNPTVARKPRNMNSRQERHRRVWWRKR